MPKQDTPMRFNIIKQLYHSTTPLTAAQVYEQLAPMYPGEKQCSALEIDRQLMTLKTVGVVEEESVDDSGSISYLITAYGRERAEKNIQKFL